MPQFAEHRDHQIVDRFIEHLAGVTYPGLRLDHRPDQIERNEPAIDAITKPEPLAIEHTSISIFPDQDEEAEWAREITNLHTRRPELIDRLEHHSVVVAIHPGRLERAKRQEFFDRLVEWIGCELPRLMSQIAHCPTRRFIEVPREALSTDPKAPRVTIFNIEDHRRGPGKVLAIFWGEFRNESEALTNLAPRLEKQIRRKASKLMPHANWGRTRILLIEARYPFLTNDLMLEAVFRAYPTSLPQGIDRLWYVESTNEPCFFNLTEQLRRRQLGATR